MCRSIKTLRRNDESATLGEVDAAALRFVRKVSGFRQPSRKNEAAFSRAVEEISTAAAQLLREIGTPIEKQAS